MWIVSQADNQHEMSKLIFYEKNTKKKQEAHGHQLTRAQVYEQKSTSATLTLLHSELVLCTFKILFFSI